jgi:hypothetical protein
MTCIHERKVSEACLAGKLTEADREVHPKTAVAAAIEDPKPQSVYDTDHLSR